MKIYVVTKGSYSDYHIVAATLDKEKAEKIAKRFSDNYDECDVEEYEDSEVVLKPYWYVRFQKDTSEVIELCDESRDDYALHTLNLVNEYRDGNIAIRVAADTPEEAIKIASEKRAEYLAKREGVC